jgi:chloramphenicol O-acetyltransferase
MTLPIPIEIQEHQPDWPCLRCGKRADDAEAVTLAPWSLTATHNTVSGWLCGTCATALRKFLRGENA